MKIFSREKRGELSPEKQPEELPDVIIEQEPVTPKVQQVDEKSYSMDDQKFSEIPTTPEKTSEENTVSPTHGISDKEKQFLQRLTKFGCAVSPCFDENDISEPLKNLLEIHRIGDRTLYFHSPSSIEIYAQATNKSSRKLASKTLLNAKIPELLFPLLFNETLILQTLDQYKKKAEIHDYISSVKPDKKKSIKIRRIDKRTSFEPIVVVVLYKNKKKCALIFDIIEEDEELFPGERLEECESIIIGYHKWLKDKERVHKWLQKKSLYIPQESLAIALLFDSSGETDVVNDCIELCKSQGITSPIYFGYLASFLQRPFCCWQIAGSGNGIFLKGKRYPKTRKSDKE